MGIPAGCGTKPGSESEVDIARTPGRGRIRFSAGKATGLLTRFRIAAVLHCSAVNRRVVGSNPTRGAKFLRYEFSRPFG
jgi:hypothetical protein